VSGRSIAKVLFATAVALALLWFLYQVRSVLGLVAISVFLAVALGPAVDFFQRRRLPRAASILLVYLLIVLALFGVGLLIVPPVVEETTQFVQDVPGYIDGVRGNPLLRQYDDRYGITEQLQRQAEGLPARLGQAVATLQSVTVGVFSTLFQLITVLVITLFLLLDGKRIVAFAFQQMSPEHERRARTIADDIYAAVGGYVVGAFSLALIAGVSTFVVLSILGVRFAIPLAVMMAFLDLIPMVGATAAGVLIAVAAAFENFPTALIAWVVFFVIYQQVENNFLQPVVYRRTVALAPLLVIVAVLMGASLLGVLGALLAIPVAATVQILVKDFWHFSRHPGAVLGADHSDPPGDAAEEPAGGDTGAERPREGVGS
jgi:predicted PurR-regulated permease PerM